MSNFDTPIQDDGAWQVFRESAELSGILPNSPGRGRVWTEFSAASVWPLGSPNNTEHQNEQNRTTRPKGDPESTSVSAHVKFRHSYRRWRMASFPGVSGTLLNSPGRGRVWTEFTAESAWPLGAPNNTEHQNDLNRTTRLVSPRTSVSAD